MENIDYSSIKSGQILWAIKQNRMISDVIVISVDQNNLTIKYKGEKYDVSRTLMGKRLFKDKYTAEKYLKTNLKLLNDVKSIPSLEPKINLGGCGFNNGNSFGKSTPGKIKIDELYH